MTNRPNTTNETTGIDWTAVYARIEFIADTLRIPHPEVEKARQSDDDLTDFIRRYKQSFDWVIDGDPSSMISWLRRWPRPRTV